MPATAYSKTFAQELDLQQLLARLREVALTQVDPKGEVSEAERAWIRRDVICTCCSVDGALVVRAGRNKTGRLVRQGHFRFRSLTGEDAHHRLCEFYGNETGQPTGAEKVRFSSTAGSALTRAVGELVSRGIEREVFTSEQMQAMRRWYFEAKVASRFKVVARPEIFTWLATQARQPSARSADGPPDDLDAFDPAFGDLPTFKWRRAAVDEVTRRDQPVVQRLDGISEASVKTAAKLAAKLDGQDEFDRGALRAEYAAALDLAKFIAIHADLHEPKVPAHRFASVGAPSALLALSALLLFRTGYDRRAARRLFVELQSGPSAQDPRRGNIIGLNPFHDFDAWRAIKLASDLTAETGWSFNRFDDINLAEARLKAAHRTWRAAGRP